MPHSLYQVDAFTDVPFKGNPAAVCLLGGPEPETWMQSLAAEMNLSETAFLLPEGDGWRLRWFTPAVEVDLCGHATLASAKVLFTEHPALRKEPIKFFTRSGELMAWWKEGAIELDFPAMRPENLNVPDGIELALGFQPVKAAFSGNYFVFEAADEGLIREAKPDFPVLKTLPMPEVIITAKSDGTEFDFISRFYAPQLGINEDPATGSAHCLLAPYWAQKTGKREFCAYQASKRGGTLHLRLDGERVRITGEAVIIFTAELFV
jgi:PhzF family phenazine biosynthesis protein